uniref:Nicotinate phosphoribosyltransferase n=1 Tax=Meloidogyne javanica TaxID=6303 RepID=A0A915LFX6_MELJA
MAYAYWQQGIHNKTAQSDLEFISQKLSYADKNFFEYLRQFNCENIILLAIPEGSIVFPKIPLIIVEGPLAVCQMLETTLLNLVNFASLVTTNAARFRLAAGDQIELMEFGLRRAQGPNGGLSASKYCYIGGFDSTSNLLAGKLFGIPVSGTMAHSFVTAFKDEPLNKSELIKKDSDEKLDLQKISQFYLEKIFEKFDWGISKDGVNIGELNAFCAYAISHPNSFVALIDTYDTLRSGLCNFIAVTLALNDLGYKSVGCRIDSGDLAYLSNEIRNRFELIALSFKIDWITNLKIVASNDINEETIRSLYNQGHKINTFGIGTHLVTCQKQPALGCIYKLVDLDGEPKIKISEDISKMTIPGRKSVFRLYGKAGFPLVDLMILENDEEPKLGQEIFCRHPFQPGKRARITPQRVEKLHKIYWKDNSVQQILPNIKEIREYTHQSLINSRPDHLRPLNPTPYKVSLSPKLFDFINNVWLNLAPVGQLQ